MSEGVVVTLNADEYEYVGNDRPPCWMVPQSSLRPIEELQR
jgi:hypothetical protein